jgi:hypothetical protein
MTETTMTDLDLEVDALQMLHGQEAQLLVENCTVTCPLTMPGQCRFTDCAITGL